MRGAATSDEANYALTEVKLQRNMDWKSSLLSWEWSSELHVIGDTHHGTYHVIKCDLIWLQSAETTDYAWNLPYLKL